MDPTLLLFIHIEFHLNFSFSMFSLLLLGVRCQWGDVRKKKKCRYTVQFVAPFRANAIAFAIIQCVGVCVCGDAYVCLIYGYEYELVVNGRYVCCHRRRTEENKLLISLNFVIFFSIYLSLSLFFFLLVRPCCSMAFLISVGSIRLAVCWRQMDVGRLRTLSHIPQHGMEPNWMWLLVCCCAPPPKPVCLLLFLHGHA